MKPGKEEGSAECPNCGSGKIDVIDAEISPVGNLLYEIYGCPDCGYEEEVGY